MTKNNRQTLINSMKSIANMIPDTNIEVYFESSSKSARVLNVLILRQQC